MAAPAGDDADAQTTDSGLPLLPYYTAASRDAEGMSEPGEYPFTRGNHPGGYRKRLWTFRQYSGFGTPEESNQRYRLLLERGGTGLSVALDLPTQIGFDSDDPDVATEVGKVGVAIDSLADMEILFRDIPLAEVSTSFTINGTAAILLAMYIAVGDLQGVPRDKLRGTIQNDILKEYVARGTWIWPAEPSIRLIADTIEYCAANVPKFNAVSVAGAHFRDAGATAAQELAFTLQDAVTYCEAVVARGNMAIDDFASTISFFFYTHNDFFEEVAKYRAGRRIWAQIVRERFGATNPKSSMFRIGVVCGGSTLHVPQPMNNAIRVAYQAMAAALGGVQSMFTAAWDEPFALPSEETAMFALRTQQVLAYETGIARVADPLGGSYYVESLTDAMEVEVRGIMTDLEARGGMVDAVETGYVQSLIADNAYQAYHDVHDGTRVVVGVNRFRSDEPVPEVEAYQMSQESKQRQLDRLARVKATRDSAEVERALATLRKSADDDTNMMPILVDAVRAYCTVGEIVATLKDCWGEFREPRVF